MYTIKNVSMVTGIGVHTLRAWEKRYGIVKPQRSESGRRFYSDEDIEKLKSIAKLTKSGEQISSLANYSSAELEEKAKEISDEILNEEESTRLQSSIFILKKAFDLGVQDVIFHELTTLGQEVSEKKFRLENYLEKLVIPFYQYVVSADEGDTQLKAFCRTIFMLMSSNLKITLAKAIDEYNTSEKQVKAQTPIFVGSSGSVKGEIDSLICCIKSYMNGREAIYIGSKLNADVISELIESMPESKFVITDRYVSEKPYPELFDLMARFREDSLQSADVAVLLHKFDHLQRSDFKNSNRVKTFESFDSLNCFFNNAC